MENINLIVSVIIPCYNDGLFIREAIESVEQCKQSVYEIIIVNDGSTDKYTLNLLKELEMQGYNIINQSNMGLPSARNAGIAVARGKYILPLDSDNTIKAEYITKAIAAFERDESISVVYSELEYFGEKKGVSNITSIPLMNLYIHNFIDACAFFRKSCWDKFGGFDQNMLSGFEDWEFWLRLHINDQRFFGINEVLFNYRVRKNSLVHFSILPENYWALRQYILKKYPLQYVHYIDYLNTEISNYYFDRRHPVRSFFKYCFLSYFKNDRFLR